MNDVIELKKSSPKPRLPRAIYNNARPVQIPNETPDGQMALARASRIVCSRLSKSPLIPIGYLNIGEKIATVPVVGIT